MNEALYNALALDCIPDDLLTLFQHGTVLNPKFNEHLQEVIDLYSQQIDETPIEQNRRRHLDALITILTVRALASAEEYQQFITQIPILATIFMKKRLETLINLDAQKALIAEVLEHYQDYDWRFPQFLPLFEEHLLNVFLHFTPKEEPAFKRNLQRYYTHHVKTHAAGLLLFFQTLIERSDHQQRLLSSLNSDKNIAKNSMLICLILQLPTIRHEFLNTLLSYIDHTDLLRLLSFLVSTPDQATLPSDLLDKILSCFSERLLLKSAVNHDPIHQWQHLEPIKQSQQLALRLISNPHCFKLLSERSSRLQRFTPNLLQGVLTIDATLDLKYRISSVLQLLNCSADQFSDIALKLLCHFKDAPYELQTIFINLEAVYSQLNERGQANYRHLKYHCWDLLKSPEEQHQLASPDELTSGNAVASINTLLTSQLCTPHCWDWFLIRLIKQHADNNPALLLTKIHPIKFCHLPHTTLVQLLLMSTTPQTHENWKNIELFLKQFEEAPTAYRLSFAQQLLQQRQQMEPLEESSHVSAAINTQVWSLITNLTDFHHWIAELTTTELQWLIAQSPTTYLQQHLANWLYPLLTRQSTTIKPQDLLALLPQDEAVLNTLLTNDKLLAYLPLFFIQLSEHTQNHPRLLMIYTHVNTWAVERKKQFISNLHQLLQCPKSMPQVNTSALTLHKQATIAHALPLVTKLLLDLQTLSVQDSDDRKLIQDHVQLFHQLSKPENGEVHLDEEQIAQLQQALFNVLNFLNEQDKPWALQMIQSPAFAAFAPRWLERINSNNLPTHPFTQLLTEYCSAQLHTELLNHPSYQHYLKQLLAAPPATLRDEQFILLFRQLFQAHQTQLATTILRRLTELTEPYPFSLDSLATLSKTLTIDVLYDLAYEQDLPPPIFIELIAEHPDGLDKLSVTQRHYYFSSLRHGKQLLAIFNSHTPVSHKCQFVEKLITYVHAQQANNLSMWFQRLQLDAETLAALTNYTTNPNTQKLVNTLLLDDHVFQSLMKTYVEHPTLSDMHIETHGLLYAFIEQMLLQPELGYRCHPSLFAIIQDDSIAKQILYKQFLYTQALNQLPQFYAPLITSESNADGALIAARWVQQLPLLTGGVLQILNDYPHLQCSNTLQAIQNTPLYQTIIHPLCSQQSGNEDELLALPFTQLYPLLVNFAKAIRPHDKTNSHKIMAAINQYEHRLNIIKHVSFSGAEQFFDPQSPLAQHPQNTPLTLEKTAELSQAQHFHHEFLQNYPYQPSPYFNILLKIFVLRPQRIPDHEFQTWFIHSVLMSAQLDALPDELAVKLVTQYTPTDFMQLLNISQRQLTKTLPQIDKLLSLKSLKTIEKVIQQLLTEEQLEELLELSRLAEQPYLQQLIRLAQQIQQCQGSKTTLLHTLLPPTTWTEHYEFEWLEQELNGLEQAQQQLIQRHYRLTQLGFFYREDRQTIERLNQLPRLQFLNNPTKFHAQCLNSYGAIFKNQDKNAIHAFLLNLTTLIYKSPTRNELLAFIAPELLQDVMTAALQCPDRNDHLIYQLIEANETTFYLLLVQTELGQALQQYQINTIAPAKNLNDLTLDEIAAITPTDFQRILYLQRLARHLHPLPEFQSASIVQMDSNSTHQAKEMIYFAADASLYELITEISEHVMTTNDTSINAKLQDALEFIKNNNQSVNYWHWVEDINRYTTPLPAHVLYHYLNFVSFLADDKTLQPYRQGFAKLLQQTTLPLSALLRLQKNCSSKIIHSIFTVHLLCRADFIEALSEPPLLTTLTKNHQQLIARPLQYYIQTIELSVIPLELLKQLTPEAAANLFCSATHFHELNQRNIPILLNTVGNQRDALLRYWITRYANMPNYSIPLTELAKKYPDQVQKNLKEIPLIQREKILLNLLGYTRSHTTLSNTLTELIATLLKDYLNDYQTTHQQCVIHHFWEPLKQADGKIMAHLLQQDTDNLLKTLGKQNDYPELIQLYSTLLPHLNHSRASIKATVEKALNEVIFESTLSQMSRFFSSLRYWFKRCSFYGWSGFFTPKKPTYTETFNNKQPRPGNTKPSRCPTLEEVINNITDDSNTTELQECYAALQRYEHEPKFEQELSIRQKVDVLFSKLLLKKNTLPTINVWLSANHDAFIINRRHLIGHYCQLGKNQLLDELLNAATKMPPNFNPEEFAQIQQELFCADAPRLNIAKTTPNATLGTSLSSYCLNQLSGLLSKPNNMLRTLWGYKSRFDFWRYIPLTGKAANPEEGVQETTTLVLRN